MNGADSVGDRGKRSDSVVLGDRAIKVQEELSKGHDRDMIGKDFDR